MTVAGHRAAVGPIDFWDRVPAHVFGLLVAQLGMRARHRLLDVGCGCLRIGRVLIPYLDHGNYKGIEPDTGLLHLGIERELGGELLAVRDARFSSSRRPEEWASWAGPQDFVLCQGVASHAPLDWIRSLASTSSVLLERGGYLVLMYLAGDPYRGEDWKLLPDHVTYNASTLEARLKIEGFEVFHSYQGHPGAKGGARWIIGKKR